MNTKGFTIVEALIAVFILAIGIVAVLNIFPLGIQIVKSAQTASTATQLGQAKIEEMLSRQYEDAALSGGQVTEDYGSIIGFDSYKRVTNVSCVNYVDFSEVSCDYDPVKDPNPLKKIDVTVSWRSSLASEQDINLVSLITKR